MLLFPEMLPNKIQDTPLLFLFFIYCSVRDTGEVRHLTRIEADRFLADGTEGCKTVVPFSSPQHQRPPLPAGLQGKGEILARWAVGSVQVNRMRIQLREETVKTLPRQAPANRTLTWWGWLAEHLQQ